MDAKTFLPKNESNEETEQNLNQQPTTPTPVLYNNQNNNEQTSINAFDIETDKPQLTENPPQESGLPSEIDYSKYTNINQLNHRRINQIDNNTFQIRKTCADEICGIFIFFIDIIVFIGFILFGIFLDIIIMIVIGAVMLLFGIWWFYELCCDFKKTINIILRPSIIIVEEIACKKNVTQFYTFQLSKVELAYESDQDCDCTCKYSYKIIFKMRDEHVAEKTFFEISRCKQIYTPEEIGYFNYVMKNHLQTKMK